MSHINVVIMPDDTLYQNPSAFSTTFENEYHNNSMKFLKLKILHWHDNNYMFNCTFKY